jgi:hypothetical protein
MPDFGEVAADITRRDGMPNSPQETHRVGQIVDGEEAKRGQFVGDEKVTEIGAVVVATGVAGTIIFEWSAIGHEFGAP